MTDFFQPTSYQPVMPQQGMTSPLVQQLLQLFGGRQPFGTAPPAKKAQPTQPVQPVQPAAPKTADELWRELYERWIRGEFGPSSAIPGTPAFPGNVPSGNPANPWDE